MRIGIDFDNTIACYDGLFHALALEQQLIPKNLPTDKTAVRDYLRSVNNEDAWTTLQGVGYGPAITRASPYEGVQQFITQHLALGHDLCIVSHKTRTPYRGDPHNLHAAARRFLAHHGVIPDLLPEDRAYFELTKQAKLDRIATLRCTVFIDDLPEFLAEPGFPPNVRRILFDPADRYRDESRFERHTSWSAVASALLADVEPRMNMDKRG